MTTPPDWFDATGVTALAQRYAIPLRPWYRQAPPRLDEPFTPPNMLPAGSFGICTDDGAVLYQCSPHPALGTNMDVLNVLHEIAHVLCTPTSLLHEHGLDALWEGWLLVPVEWALIQELTVEPGRRLHIVWCGWRATPLILPAPAPSAHRGTMVDAWRRPRRARWWRDAVALGQRVGLLDDRERLTGRRADWSLIDDPIRSARNAQAACYPPRRIRS